MHLQQTKKGSRTSGGPQYYFHDLPEHVKLFLRKNQAVRVALVTPYGATKSDFFALSKDAKFDAAGKVVSGAVGHDRIQQGSSATSIGEAIRTWFSLPKGDFDRIDLNAQIIENIFYLTPTSFVFSGKTQTRKLPVMPHPLSFNHEYKSPLWIKQIESLDSLERSWVREEICRVMAAHQTISQIANVLEPDLLRCSGALKKMGVSLGPYVGKGYDCCFTGVTFLKYPEYQVPFELKKKSSGFSYQEGRYGKEELSRAVILCATHDLHNLRENIDVISLHTMCEYLRD
jgi:hypothetical protein